MFARLLYRKQSLFTQGDICRIARQWAINQVRMMYSYFCFCLWICGRVSVHIVHIWIRMNWARTFLLKWYFMCSFCFPYNKLSKGWHKIGIRPIPVLHYLSSIAWFITKPILPPLDGWNRHILSFINRRPDHKICMRCRNWCAHTIKKELFLRQEFMSTFWSDNKYYAPMISDELYEYAYAYWSKYNTNDDNSI